MPDSIRPWRVVRRKQLIANQWIGVRGDECVTGRGVPAEYFVVEKKDFVVAVALTPRNELLLVRQYKHPAGEIVVECPAGYVDSGEAPIAAVARELREETGYSAGEVRHLGTWHSNPAVLTNRAHFFLCLDAVPTRKQELDQTEDIAILTVDFAEALRQIERGGLVSDVPSVAAIALAGRVLEAGRLGMAPGE